MQAMQQLFQRSDRNHFGQVDATQIGNLCKILEVQGDLKCLDASFKLYDFNGNGLLTLEEFARSLAAEARWSIGAQIRHTG